MKIKPLQFISLILLVLGITVSFTYNIINYSIIIFTNGVDNKAQYVIAAILSYYYLIPFIIMSVYLLFIYPKKKLAVIPFLSYLSFIISIAASVIIAFINGTSSKLITSLFSLLPIIIVIACRYLFKSRSLATNILVYCVCGLMLGLKLANLLYKGILSYTYTFDVLLYAGMILSAKVIKFKEE